MRCLSGLIHLGLLIASVDVLAQTAPPATPGPEAPPAPVEPASRRQLRLVPPVPSASPDPSQALLFRPVEMFPANRGGSSKPASGNELVVAPIPMSSPSIGSGLGLVAVYTVAKKASEEPSPPTTIGAGGFYTGNGSWAGGVGVKLYAKADHLRATVGAGAGSINYDLFAGGPTGNGVPITQKVRAAIGEVMVGVGSRWYLGLSASYTATTVGLRSNESDALPFPLPELDVKLATVGLKAERDSRDSVFYPTDGSRLELLVSRSDPTFGSDYRYDKTTASYTDYLRVGASMVLAWQVAGCSAGRSAPFFDLCLFGSNNMLRGYTSGAYLDRWTLATQAEARWRFARRWITTAFVGVGAVEPRYGLAPETDWLPAGGVGLQWIAALENMIALRVDYAFGKNDSRGLYIGIGQAF